MASVDRQAKEGRGLLIALEGIDGTGKSTQMSLLSEALRAMGHKVVVTREPTDGPYGQRIRELFGQRHEVSHQEELELFLADRRQHVEQVIAPALARGEIVLTDRYYLSTAAYQGANTLDAEEILRTNELFAPQPDLALLLVLSPAQSVHRIRTLRNEELNDFEQEAGLGRVAAIFDRLDRDYIQRVDGSLSVEEVHRQLLGHMQKLLRDKPLAIQGGGNGGAA
jgi:dTMP kinase